ncbi:MAG: DEAD/DEAH box helicase [Treponema sp.]|nr:DEAD/DEAH box helicase [Treponema sp.]
MTYSAYDRLAPFVREFIYRKRWKTLRGIQEETIRQVLDGDRHLLIAAGTASGKTEACFFPIISRLWQRRAEARRDSSVDCLYIGPLKALINDQFERLAPLMEEAEIPLWRWHGDVSDNHKKKLLENPSGVLQITPESLEALLLRSPRRLLSLFRNLSFVIIDEVHAFMGSDRGGQILCQLVRIADAARSRPRRIGLSATLGDYRKAMEWLAAGSGSGGAEGGSGGVTLIREGSAKRRISVAVDYFSRAGGEEEAYYRGLYRQIRERRCIIFTNSRLDAEECIASLRELAAKSRGEERFHIHHGSVSAALRQETERELRESSHPMTTAATATLEMGIDIGALDRVIQIGPPASVSAFVQRLGRSGRRRGKPEIYFSSLEERRRDAFPLPWGLLKTVAVVELYLKEKWIEDSPEPPYPLSLLLHQTLSVLCSLGEHHPAALKARVLSLPGFSRVAGEDYDALIEQLLRLELLERTEEGNLITGLAGEALTGHYSFYSVFAEAGEYRVMQGDRELGRINFIPPRGSSITLGGRYWKTERIERKHREIFVVPGEPGSRRIWRGGGTETHRRVVRRMRELLTEDAEYAYLSAGAAAALRSARTLAGELSLGREILVPGGEEGACRLLPWMGSRGMRTLLLILQNGDISDTLALRRLARENDFSLRLETALPAGELQARLRKTVLDLDPAGVEGLVDPAEVPFTGKFDEYLPPRLLAKQWAANMLDLEEVRGLF